MDSDRSTLEVKPHLRLVNRPAAEAGAAGAGPPLIRNGEIQLDSRPRKLIAILLILCTSGFLVYRTWWLFLAAWITRSKTMDPVVYERAIQYDPNNADYHFVLAQIYNYATQSLDVKRAREEYEAAVRLNPYRSAHWIELSKFYEQEGDLERCRDAMIKALETDPNYAQTHWAAANLYVRLNDQEAANHELRRAADLDPVYIVQVLDLAWRMYEDPELIMRSHIPNSKVGNLTALNYFVSHQSLAGAELAWNRLKGFETSMSERLDYSNYLVGLNRVQPAWEVFAAGLPAPEAGVPSFHNGGFESPMLNGGFDWFYSSNEAAEVRRDTITVKDGMASLLVAFSGKENVDYRQLSHRLFLEKGKRYTLSFWMKTESISTNEGVYVDVDSQPSARQVGTTPWQEFTIPFTATAELVQVRLRRDPSRKLDNLLAGKVWLDAFSIREIPSLE